MILSDLSMDPLLLVIDDAAAESNDDRWDDKASMFELFFLELSNSKIRHSISNISTFIIIV